MNCGVAVRQKNLLCRTYERFGVRHGGRADVGTQGTKGQRRSGVGTNLTIDGDRQDDEASTPLCWALRWPDRTL
ncbi:hypothetical protein J6590_013981 [Homalodisca vitripennis]|nr:hypothetical protein J6590_013981 [Homalodisca vitripennis]